MSRLTPAVASDVTAVPAATVPVATVPFATVPFATVNRCSIGLVRALFIIAGLAVLAALAFMVGVVAQLPHASGVDAGHSVPMSLPPALARGLARAAATVPDASTFIAGRPAADEEPASTA